MYSQAEMDAMTAPERELAREMNAAEETGEDVFGDGTPAEAQEPEIEAAAEGTAAERLRTPPRRPRRPKPLPWPRKR